MIELITKGGKFLFTPNKLRIALLEQFEDVGRYAARRMEQEAKMFLSERVGEDIKGPVSKSSGTLEEGIKGYFYSTFDSVYCGVSASALELGQWEASRGEYEEAEKATMANPFDYAAAVEGGTGIYGPRRKVIRATGDKKMVFWNGTYRKSKGEFKKEIHAVEQSSGQKGKNFLRDAVRTSVKPIVDLIGKVGENIKIDDVVKWGNK